MGRKDNIIPIDGDDLAALPLGARMRYTRLKNHISLTEMARRLGYTKSHLSTVENNIGRPSRALIEGYELELNLAPDELLSVKDTEQPTSNRPHPSLPYVSQEQQFGREGNAIYNLDKR